MNGATPHPIMNTNSCIWLHQWSYIYPAMFVAWSMLCKKPCGIVYIMILPRLLKRKKVTFRCLSYYIIIEDSDANTSSNFDEDGKSAFLVAFLPHCVFSCFHPYYSSQRPAFVFILEKVSRYMWEIHLSHKRVHGPFFHIL